jgi:DeoR/GlpR family transcriptional regulator of sugar metabolism
MKVKSGYGERKDRMKSRDSIGARRYKIIEAVAQKGTLSLVQLRELVGKISAPTLRKDIEVITRLPSVFKDSCGGLATRSHGLFESTYFSTNLEVDASKKKRIAERLIEGNPPFECFPLINLSGDACVVGPGTTTLEVLCFLGKYPGVEVLTTNLGVLKYPDLLIKASFHLSGGWCLTPVASLVGTTAVRNINDFVANSSIIGVSGLDVSDDGREVLLYAHHEAQLPVKKALIENRQKVIVVTCGSKIGKRDAFIFAKVSEILEKSNFYIITDSVQKNICKSIQDCLSKLSENNHNIAKLIELEESESTK